jgi:hypothetical protein
MDAIMAMLAGGEAAGSQAQGGILLQLITRIVNALENGGGGGGSGATYAVTEWTGGNLNIATAFPNLSTRTFSIKPASPGPITVTLPAVNGPWLVVDGSGFCSPANQITIQAASGVTIQGQPANYFVQAWQSGIFVLDTTNYNIF